MPAGGLISLCAGAREIAQRETVAGIGTAVLLRGLVIEREILLRIEAELFLADRLDAVEVILDKRRALDVSALDHLGGKPHGKRRIDRGGTRIPGKEVSDDPRLLRDIVLGVVASLAHCGGDGVFIILLCLLVVRRAALSGRVGIGKLFPAQEDVSIVLRFEALAVQDAHADLEEDLIIVHRLRVVLLADALNAAGIRKRDKLARVEEAVRVLVGFCRAGLEAVRHRLKHLVISVHAVERAEEAVHAVHRGSLIQAVCILRGPRHDVLLAVRAAHGDAVARGGLALLRRDVRLFAVF